MKRLTLLFPALLTTFALLGQGFEGKIVYANSFKSKNPQLSDAQWTTLMGKIVSFRKPKPAINRKKP